MTAPGWLCLVFLVATYGTPQAAPVAASDRAAMDLVFDAAPAAAGEPALDLSTAAAESCETSSPAPAVVPEVATLLFLASGGTLILARHRHPRRQLR